MLMLISIVVLMSFTKSMTIDHFIDVISISILLLNNFKSSTTIRKKLTDNILFRIWNESYFSAMIFNVDWHLAHVIWFKSDCILSIIFGRRRNGNLSKEKEKLIWWNWYYLLEYSTDLSFLSCICICFRWYNFSTFVYIND